MPTKRRQVYKGTVKYATIEDVEEAAKGWNPGQVDCRSGLYANHNWQPFTARRYPKNVIGITQQCENCTNRRHRRMSGLNGRWLDDTWTPLYRDGYLMQPGRGRVSPEAKEALRMMALSHLSVTNAKAGDDDA